VSETKNANGNGSGLSLKGNGIILVLLSFTAMMVMFIEIMLVPALPIIAQDFNDTSGWISWVLSVYLLVGAVATPLLGRLGDIYGKKKVLVIAMAVYILALAGCSISWSLPSLIGFRAVQGIGMGMFPLAFGIVRDTFSKDNVPVAIGVISAMFSVGVSIGLLGGGYIVSVLSWRDCFYIVTPLFVVLAFLVSRLIKDGHVKTSGSLDVPGAAMLGGSVFAFLLALNRGSDWGWESAAIIGLFAASVILLAVFILWERRTPDPVIRLKLFANRGIMGANITSVFAGVSMFLMFQTLPFFLMSPTAVGGLALADAFIVGVYMFPSAGGQLVFAPLAGILGRKIGPDKVLAAGMAILFASYMLLIQFHRTELGIMLSMLVAGIGLGFVMVSLINLVALSSSQKEFGVASGMNTLFRVIGGSIGPVLGSVILAGFMVSWNPPGSPASVTVKIASETGYVWAWTVGAICAIIGMIAALVFRSTEGSSFTETPEGSPAATQE